ncbi:hypothetical protein SVIOM342S_10047 [Streptomyces violaceorubidus]
MDTSRARPRRLLASVAVPLSSLLLATGCSDAGSGTDRGSGSAREGDPAQAAAPRAASELEADYERVIKDVLPSVVQIQAGDSLGSGIVYDDKGHVVTNAHVVGDTKSFRVTTARAEGTLTAKLVSSYPEQDLAVDQAGQGARGHEGGPLRGLREGRGRTDRAGDGLAARPVVQCHAGHRVGDRADRDGGQQRGRHGRDHREHGADVGRHQPRQQRGRRW